MSWFTHLLDNLLGKPIDSYKSLKQPSAFETSDGCWVLDKVCFIQIRPGLRFGNVDLSPVKIVGYGYRVIRSPRAVHPEYLFYRKLDIHAALEHAITGMRMADQDRLELSAAFR